MNVQQIESSINQIENHIQQKDPTIERIFIEADPLEGTTRRLPESDESSKRQHRR